MSETIHLHPLVFTLHDVITGCGFLAGIIVTGKAVMEHEDDKWWMYGVCPGAVAGSGETPQEAYVDFRNRYRAALFDIADECNSFTAFERVVREFFAEDERENARWDEGLTVLRKNEHVIGDQFTKLPRIHPGEYELGIRVERLEKKKQSSLTPANNVQDCLAKAA